LLASYDQMQQPCIPDATPSNTDVQTMKREHGQWPSTGIYPTLDPELDPGHLA